MLSKGIFILLLVMSSASAFAGLGDYTEYLIKLCPNASRLLVKKSLVEIGNKGDCSERFSSEIIQQCPKIQCRQLVDAYKYKFLNRPGLIVGE
jgi:hypothetical protein